MTIESRHASEDSLWTDTEEGRRVVADVYGKGNVELAEFMVRAANAHEALVAACQKAIAALVMPSLNLQDEAIAMLAEALEPAALTGKAKAQP